METESSIEKQVMPEVTPQTPLLLKKAYLFGALFEDSTGNKWVLDTDTRLLVRLEDASEEQRNIFSGGEDDNPVLGFNEINNIGVKKFDDLYYAINYILEMIYKQFAGVLDVRESRNLSTSRVHDKYREPIVFPFQGEKGEDKKQNKEVIASRAMTSALDQIIILLQKMREKRDECNWEGNKRAASQELHRGGEYQELEELYEIYDQAKRELDKMRNFKG